MGGAFEVGVADQSLEDGITSGSSGGVNGSLFGGQAQVDDKGNPSGLSVSAGCGGRIGPTGDRKRRTTKMLIDKWVDLPLRETDFVRTDKVQMSFFWVDPVESVR